jgi:hypothetical protein
MFALTTADELSAEQYNSALILVWVCVGIGVLILLWPGGRGRRLAWQIFALAVLGFREGLRQNVLWMMFALAGITGILAFLSDGDGTHAGRARLIIDTCFSTGEILGASLIVLLSALSVSREIESRIMYTLGTKPVPRWAILTGKALGFWAVELTFALALTVFTGVLVRAVPQRAENRHSTGLSETGTWEDLRRNALITRTYEPPREFQQQANSFVFIKPGETRTYTFDIDKARLRGEALELRLQLASNFSYSPQIPNMLLRVGYPDEKPLIERRFFAPQDRAFAMFLMNSDLKEQAPLQVTLGASDKKAFQTTILVSREHGVKLGYAADGLIGNLSKSFVLMALQGWILALITTGWSGVLSFPVTVALGLLLVLGGEMSRQALSLLQSTPIRPIDGADVQNVESFSKMLTGYIVMTLKVLPDFRTAGGPSAFIDGIYLSGFTLAQAVLWMGVVRGLGWALPGVISFHQREVGK